MDRLFDGFHEQMQLLISDCHDYDNGSEAKYKRIATSLWVLFGAGGQTSIVSQLQRRLNARFDFLDTCKPISPHNLMDSFNLIGMMVGIKDGKQFSIYMPIFDQYPSIDINSPKWDTIIKYSIWWDKKKVIKIVSRNSFYTRSNLVKTVRNQMGGAHFDEVISEIEEFYGKNAGPFIVGNSMNVTNMNKIQGRPFDNSALGANIRQIAHEAIRSFQQYEAMLGRLPLYNYPNPLAFIK